MMQSDGGDYSGSSSGAHANLLDGSPRRLVMIVLCGLIGSGKSTFAKALQEYYPDYIRCNQDLLGNRRAVVSLASKSLSSGHSVVIDRTNVDEAQRATWVELGRSFPNVEMQALVFETSTEICLARLAVRTDHETIKDPAQALRIYQQFSKEFRFPQHEEGFNKIVVIRPAEFASAIPSREEVDRVLKRIKEAPAVDVPVVRPIVKAPPRADRGRGSGYRGQHSSQWRRGAAAAGHHRGGRGGHGPAQYDWRGQGFQPQEREQQMAGPFQASPHPPQQQQYQAYHPAYDQGPNPRSQEYYQTRHSQNPSQPRH